MGEFSRPTLPIPTYWCQARSLKPNASAGFISFGSAATLRLSAGQQEPCWMRDFCTTLTARPKQTLKELGLFQSEKKNNTKTWKNGCKRAFFLTVFRDTNTTEVEELLKTKRQKCLHNSKWYKIVINPGWKSEDLIILMAVQFWDSLSAVVVDTKPLCLPLRFSLLSPRGQLSERGLLKRLARTGKPELSYIALERSPSGCQFNRYVLNS